MPGIYNNYYTMSQPPYQYAWGESYSCLKTHVMCHDISSILYITIIIELVLLSYYIYHTTLYCIIILPIPITIHYCRNYHHYILFIEDWNFFHNYISIIIIIIIIFCGFGNNDFIITKFNIYIISDLCQKTDKNDKYYQYLLCQ